MFEMSFWPVFSRAQVRSFHDRGFLVFDPGIKPADIATIIARTCELYAPPEPGMKGQGAFSHGTRLTDIGIAAVKRVATAPRVLSGLKQLFGRTALPFQTLNFPTGTEQMAHSDTIHFNSMPSGYMAGVWVALEDIDEDNGPLVYYPGSHNLPEYRMQDFGLRSSYDDYCLYEQAIDRLIKKYDLQPEYGLVRKGQAIIWHANLLHGGSAQRDKARSRHSQVTHYFFEGCRYYTPMNSTPEAPDFRKPDWIMRHPAS